MGKFILIRIGQAIITTLVMVALIFMLARLSGNALNWLVSLNTSIEVREQIARNYGLDKPMIVQYWIYLTNIAQGEFGDSFAYKKPALKIIASRVPATFQLVGVGLFVSLLFGIPIGVYSAVKRGKIIDIIGRGLAFFGMSAPAFVIGIILIYIFAVNLRILPVGGRESWQSVILPAATLSLILTAGLVRITRSSMLEVLDADYLVFARTKGVSEQKIIWKHAFKNAAIPILTYIMFLLIILISGVVVIENVFAWPGLGRLILQAILSRDYPLVQAATLLIVFMFIMINLLADIIYVYLNPTIKYT